MRKVVFPVFVADRKDFAFYMCKDGSIWLTLHWANKRQDELNAKS